MTDQPKALRVAERLEADEAAMLNPDGLTLRAARLLREQHAEIQELREFHQDVFDEKINILEDEIERLREQLRLANIDALNETAENEALRAAVLAEREECARVCEQEHGACWHASAMSAAKAAERCAAAIRARGET